MTTVNVTPFPTSNEGSRYGENVGTVRVMHDNVSVFFFSCLVRGAQIPGD